MSRLSPLRPFFLLAPLGLLYLVIGGRLVQLHGSEVELAETYAQRLDQETELLADRGQIQDRHGFPLAYDRPSFRLEIGYRWDHRRYNAETWPGEPLSEAQIRDEVQDVAQVAGLDPELLEAQLRNPTQALSTILDGIDPFHAERIRGVVGQYPGFGLVLRERRTRVHPLGRAASHLVGTYAEYWEAVEERKSAGESAEAGPVEAPQLRLKRAASGIERAFMEELTGIPGSKESLRIRRGIDPSKRMVDPIAGESVRTTLDAVLQQELAEELHRAQLELGAVAVSAVVLDPRTGEILAAHSVPDYEPAAPTAGPDGRGTDGLPVSVYLKLADPVVPGSTFKPFVVAHALDQGLIRPDETFPDPGWLKIPGRKVIGNADKVPTGSKTGAECVVHSSNVVAVQIAQRIGVPGMRAFYESLGLYESIALPGHRFAMSQPVPDDEWRGRKGRAYTMPTMAFGQGFYVNPLRYAGVFAAFANGGRPVDPHLVRGTGQPCEPLFDQAAVDYVTEAMHTMVERRTRDVLPDLGIAWAGKSGTARNPGDHNRNTVLFAAFGPVGDARALVLVVVQEPDVAIVGNPSGTKHAGPIAGRLLGHALRRQGVLPRIDPRSLESSPLTGTLNTGHDAR